MKDRETISVTQAAILLFAFLSGSSMIIIPGPLVSISFNAAWISILIAMALGALLLGFMLYMQKCSPGLTFIAHSRKTIGLWPMVIIACLILTMAFHMAAGIYLDVSSFMTSMMQPETPQYVFSGLLYLITALFIRGGIEGMARMFAILVTIMMLFWAAVLILLIPTYQPDFLLPVFPEGIKPMLLGTYLSFGIPYGEIVLFAMVLPFVRTAKPSKPLKKALFWAVLANGAVLVTSTVCTIMALGPVATEKKYSLFVLSQLIEIADIIERIEAVVGMSLIMGSLMKSAITLFVIQLIVTELFRLRDDRLLTNPLCLTAQLLALTLPTTSKEWEEMVLVVHPLWVIAVYLFPFVLVTAVTFCKQRWGPARGVAK